jgi:hypothetical protein
MPSLERVLLFLEAYPLWVRLAVLAWVSIGVFGAAAILLFVPRNTGESKPVETTERGGLDESKLTTALLGQGGTGGSAKVIGNHSQAFDGGGGQGGIGGEGGRGGNAEAKGDYAFAMGGVGGNAGQPDGRGGRRAFGPLEELNQPTFMWPFGRGAIGANAPEYERRLKVLTKIRDEYMVAFPEDIPFIKAGVDQVPVTWVNKRLEEMGEEWRVNLKEGGGYELLRSLHRSSPRRVGQICGTRRW